MKRTASDSNSPAGKTNVEAACKAIIFCGAPGSGKGTQCAKLVAEFGYNHLSTGYLLRDAVKANTDLGKQANAFMEKGELVPDNLVIGVVQEQMNKPELKNKGWILDGFPRTKAQAEALAKAGLVPDKIICLEVPDTELVDRVVGRRMDPVNGAIYHVKHNPPPAEVASRVIIRPDDTEEKLKTRLAMYHEHNNTILEFYQGKTTVEKIDGTKQPAEVYSNVHNAVLHKASPAPAAATGANAAQELAAKTEKGKEKAKYVYIDADEEEESSGEEEQNSGDDYRDDGRGGDDDDDDVVDDDAAEDDD